MSSLIIALKDENLRDISSTLERNHIVFNYPYQRHRGNLPNRSYIEYLENQNCFLVYAYPEETKRKVDDAVLGLRRLFPSFAPEYAGLGESVEDGSVMRISKRGITVDEELETIVKYQNTRIAR